MPMYLVRQYHGTMELVIEPEVEMVRNGALANDIAENTQRVVLYLESLIRRYPDQWNWLTVRMTNYQERSAQRCEKCLTELALIGEKGEAGKTSRGL